MTLLALVVVAATVMAAAWALHPRRARAGMTDDASPEQTSRFQRLTAHFHHDGNGNGHGNGHAPAETTLAESLAESPVVTPAARDDVVLQEHSLEGFDLRSVVRFSARFFTCVLAALIVATFALWVVASLLGLVSDFEGFMEGVGFSDFHLLSIEFLLGVCLLGAAFSIFMAVLMCTAAALYNVLAHRWEGVTVYLGTGSPAGAPTTKQTSAQPSETMVSSDGDTAPPPPLPRRRVLRPVGRRARS